LHGNGLALEVPEELPRFSFGTQISLIFSVKRIAREGIRICKCCIVAPGAIGLQREPEEALGFSNESRINSAGRGWPGFSLFALEPAPEWQEPADEEESKPNVENPWPGAELGPAKGCIEVDKRGCWKNVQWEAPLICKFLITDEA
jgi:hypothetical protein